MNSDTVDPNIINDIENGKTASATICEYVDSLLSTNNPQPPLEQIWSKPDIHPCKQKFENITTLIEKLIT